MTTLNSNPHTINRIPVPQNVLVKKYYKLRYYYLFFSNPHLKNYLLFVLMFVPCVVMCCAHRHHYHHAHNVHQFIVPCFAFPLIVWYTEYDLLHAMRNYGLILICWINDIIYIYKDYKKFKKKFKYPFQTSRHINTR